jgi:hypothetical protein
LAIVLLFFGKYMSSVHFGVTPVNTPGFLSENEIAENRDWNKVQNVFTKNEIDSIFHSSTETPADPSSICPMEPMETGSLSMDPEETLTTSKRKAPIRSLAANQVSLLSPEKFNSILGRKILEFSCSMPGSLSKKNKYKFLNLNRFIPEWAKIKLIDKIFDNIKKSRSGLNHKEMALFAPLNLRIRFISSDTMLVYSKKSIRQLSVKLLPPKPPYAKRYKKNKNDSFFILGKISEQLFPVDLQVSSSFRTYVSLNSFIKDLTNLDVNTSIDPERIKILYLDFPNTYLNSIPSTIHLSQLHQ